MLIAIKVIIRPLQMIYNLFLKHRVYSLMIGLIKFVIFCKGIKNPYHHEAIRSCCKHAIFTYDYINIYEGIPSLITQLTIDLYSVMKFKQKDLDSLSHMLLLLSSDINLNPGPVHQDTLKCANKWKVFKSRSLRTSSWNIRTSYSPYY